MADITLTVDGTDDAANHKFLTLDAAIDHGVADHADLTAYGLLNINITYAGNDTAPVSVTGFTVDATHYVNIYTSGDAVHAGVWSDSKYRLTRSTTTSRPLTIISAYTRVTGLQIASLSTGATGYSPTAFGYGTGILLDKCILRCNSSGTGAATGIAYASTSGANVTLRNCVMYGSTASLGAIYTVTGTTITAQNCTIYVPSAQYVAYRVAGTQTLTNCYLGGPADTVYGTVTLTTTATSDDSSDQVALRSVAAAVGSGAYFTNVTAGSENFTLTSASSPLVGAGTTIAAFTDDITDAERGATFDVGAFEFVQSYQYARPSSDVADGNWTNESATNTNIFASLDETTASDTDYARSGSVPSNDTLTVGLSSIDAPIPGTVTMKVRVKTV